MPLRIPKYVQVENFRLSIFYRLMQLGIILPLILYFFATEQYSKALSLKDHIFIDTTVRGWQNPTLLAQVAAEKATEPWCRFPSDYNFLGDFLADDSSGQHDFRFEGHQCSTICSASNNASGCLHPPDVWVKEGINEFLLLTSLRDTTYHANGASSLKAYLMPFAEVLAIAFKISYRELDKSVLRFGRTARSATGTVLSSSDFQQRTKFVSSCGKTIKELAPGEDLVLSVPELFSLVCLEGYLDRIQTSAGTNFMRGAKNPVGALGRIVGAEITISVFINAAEKSAEVTATLSPLAFVGGSRNEAVYENEATSLRFRQYNGIRIRFVAEGIQTVFDINNVILNVSALVVYVGLPIIFIKFFAVYGLGHLSKIYKDIVYAKFSISKECGAMATRLMGSSATFHQLEDVTDANGDGVHGDTGITRNKMTEHIRDVLQHRGHVIDESEMTQFVELAFNEVDIGIDRDAAMSLCGSIKASVRDFLDIDAQSKQSSVEAGIATINIDEFNTSFLAAFPMSFDSVVKLFDKDRHQNLLERFFMPSKLKKALQTAKMIEMMKREEGNHGKVGPWMTAPAGAGTEDALRSGADPRTVEAPGVPSQPETKSSPACDFSVPDGDKATSTFDASGGAQVSTSLAHVAREPASVTKAIIPSVESSNGLPPSQPRLPSMLATSTFASQPLSSSQALVDVSRNMPLDLVRIAPQDGSQKGFARMNEEVLHRLRESAKRRTTLE